MFCVFLGLGTNLGDRRANLSDAVGLLSQTVGEIASKSDIYQTAAWGITDQPDFYNQVIKVHTHLFPLQLMASILDIEQQMGRQRIVKWGERLIDIDILFFENIIISTPNLIIPHPFIFQRRFVLEPLLDVQRNFVHPVYKRTVEELIQTTSDDSTISKL